MTPSSIAAVVVTYHPAEEMIDRLHQILSQVDYLVVVDNGSPDKHRERLCATLGDTRCSFLESGVNEGIAKALNRGVQHAMGLNAEFMLLLDQDSQCEPGFVETMRDAASDTASFSGTIYSPLHISRKSGEPLGLFLGSDGEPFVVITSGSLFHRSLYERVGPFDDSLFIDMVDDEYCLRLRRLGGTIHLVREAILMHEVGDPEQYVLFGKYTFSISNHSAKRRYFIVRNRLLVLKSHYTDNPRYTIFMLRMTAIETIKIVLVPKDRMQKLWLSFRGFLDALVDRRGNKVGL